MQLYFQSYPESLERDNPVVIIPGLFGSTANWRSFAKALSLEFDVYVIDQRNHGNSPHVQSQTYADMSEDLLDFLDFHGLEKVVLCGHSMGGKTAMVFSLLYPQRVSQLAVLDIAPVEYEHSHAPFLQSLLEIDITQLKSRSEADRLLKTAIPDSATRLFLLQNLSGSRDNYYWRINLKVLLDFMPTIVGFPTQSLATLSNELDCVFIHGGLSDYLAESNKPAVEKLFPNVKYVEIADAGHWLHVEQPKAVLKALSEFLNK